MTKTITIILSVRFIGLVPFSNNEWSNDNFISYKSVLNDLINHYSKKDLHLENTRNSPNDTTKYYMV